MSFIPGLGIAKGMGLTLRRFFAPKATIQYPETEADVAVRFRGRLQLLYDEMGNVKCETCFQCAQACPVECIDMGGYDTGGRFHVHWGQAEQFAERREESALRRSGRPVPDAAYTHFAPIDDETIDRIMARHGFEPDALLRVLGDVQDEYGYLPVAALKRVSQVSGSPYALIYGAASYYRGLHLQHPLRVVGVCRCTACAMAGAGRISRILAAELGTEVGRNARNDGVALEQLAEHLIGAASPLVTLDGKPASVSAAGAGAWARKLRAEVEAEAGAGATRSVGARGAASRSAGARGAASRSAGPRSTRKAGQA
jgi:NADH:ubiquinone oxidoreductase subunit E